MYWRSHFGSSTSNLAAHSSCCSDKPGCISSVQSCYCSCILHTPDLGHTLGFTVCFRYLAYPPGSRAQGRRSPMVIQTSSMVSIPSYVFWDNLHPEWSWFHEKCWCHLFDYFPWTHRFSWKQGCPYQNFENTRVLKSVYFTRVLKSVWIPTSMWTKWTSWRLTQTTWTIRLWSHPV